MGRNRVLLLAVIAALVVGGGAFAVGRWTAASRGDTSVLTGSVAGSAAGSAAGPTATPTGGPYTDDDAESASVSAAAASSGSAATAAAQTASTGIVSASATARASRPAGPVASASRAGAATVAPAPPAPAAGGSGGTVTIAAAGDIACSPDSGSFNAGAGTSNSCRQMATSDLLLKLRPSAVLLLGDDQYEEGTLDAYNRSFAPSWGRVRSITHPAPGNHEYNSKGAAGYYAYFGAAAGDPAKGYYSYDLGAWHMIVLNSNCGPVPCKAGSAQETWLRADLAAHRNACTLAYWHHPRWSHGEHGDNSEVQPFVDDLYAGGADVILNGHDHDYERLAPQNPSGAVDAARGIREFVVGTGGRSHYQTGTGPNTEVMNDTTFGVISMTLKPTGYSWSFVPIAGSTFTDSGSATCH